MKKMIRLTESDLHRIISESVNRILAEVSKDTIASAMDGAYEKHKRLRNDPKATDAEKRAALDQAYAFDHEYNKRRDYVDGDYLKPSSDKHKAKFDKDLRDMRSGKRKYGDGPSGRRWRTNEDE